MNTVYIIGNGFDINLGLKTRFSDFADSEYWPFKPINRRHSSPLAAYLDYHKSIDKWLDLENLLGKERFNSLLGDYITKSPGKPALVARTDKRQELTTNLSEKFQEE